MITITKTNQQLGKLGENITINVQNKVPCFNDFKALDIDFYISGGFALACLIAPRLETPTPIFQPFQENNTYNSIDATYFQDIDIYFKSEKDYNLARAYLYGAGMKTFENENCETFLTKGFQIQIIKYRFGEPSELFDTFDLINSCIAIDTNFNITTHKDFYKVCFKKEVELNKIFLEGKNEEQIKSYLGILLARMRKYSERYQLDIGPKYKNILLALREAIPVIEIKYDRYVPSGSGTKLIRQTENLWTDLSSVFQNFEELHTMQNNSENNSSF